MYLASLAQQQTLPIAYTIESQEAIDKHDSLLRQYMPAENVCLAAALAALVLLPFFVMARAHLWGCFAPQRSSSSDRLSSQPQQQQQQFADIARPTREAFATETQSTSGTDGGAQPTQIRVIAASAAAANNSGTPTTVTRSPSIEMRVLQQQRQQLAETKANLAANTGNLVVAVSIATPKEKNPQFSPSQAVVRTIVDENRPLLPASPAGELQLFLISPSRCDVKPCCVTFRVLIRTSLLQKEAQEAMLLLHLRSRQKRRMLCRPKARTKPHCLVPLPTRRRWTRLRNRSS